MRYIFSILGENNSASAFLGAITVSDVLSSIIFICGVFVLINWQKRNKGFSALDSAPLRVNKMRLHVPLLQLFIWVILVAMTDFLVRRRFGEPLPVSGQYAFYFGMLAVQSGMIGSILIVAFTNFHGGFKEFGLDFKTLPNDIKWAGVNYVAVTPVILCCVWIVVCAGKLVYGSDYQLPKNQSLEMLSQIPMFLKIIVIFSAALVVPIFEELLFRGLIQSTIRTYLHSPWLAIIFSSMIFVVLHGNKSHWLALMALSICIGYAYEKSGSILRSICIHVIFNSVSIAGALLGSN
jgi:membrane protease YdiL (CAAX protease family)